MYTFHHGSQRPSALRENPLDFHKVLQIRLFNRFLSAAIIGLLTVAPLLAGQIRGRVVDAETHRPLPNANVKVEGTTLGAVSDRNGEFFLEVEADLVELSVSFIGYQSVKQTLHQKLDGPTVVTFALTSQPIAAGEVVVTSLRYEQSLKNIVAPMSVVSYREIERKAPRDVAEAMRREPGLSVTRDGVWGSNVVIRGLSRNNIVTLIDGNRIDTANDLSAGLSMIDVNDLERVEVVKGAASSLYGTGAIGGVVNVITRDGWYDSHFYLAGSMAGGYGSVNQSRYGYLRLNTGGRRWYVKLTAQSRTADDARTPLGILPNSRFDDGNLAARIGFRPFEKHEFKVNWQSYRGKDIGIPGGYPLFTDVSEVRYPRENRDLLSVEYLGTNLMPSLAKLSLKYFQQDILRDVENLPHIVRRVPGTPTKVMNVLSILPRATHKTDGFSLQSDWLSAGNYLVVGAEAWQKHLDSFRERVARIDVLNGEQQVVKSISQITAERPIPVAVYRSVGLFAQNEFPILFNRLSVTLGGRLDKIFVENEAAMQPLYQVVDGVRNDAPAGQFPLWTAVKADNFSWSGNLSFLYRVTSDLHLTLTTARSFRAPYLEERYQYIDLGNLVKIGDPLLKPEQGLFGDLGLRLYRGQTFLSLNVFINRIEDMVVEAPTTYEGRSALQKTNVGSAQLYGADAEAVVPINRQVRASAGAAFVHGQDTYLDEPLPLIPPVNGRLGLEADLGRWATAEAVAQFYGDQNRIAAWEKATPGYAVFDLYLSTRALNLVGLRTRLLLGVENLFDRAYRNHLSTNRGSITIEPGRNILLRLQTDF